MHDPKNVILLDKYHYETSTIPPKSCNYTTLLFDIEALVLVAVECLGIYYAIIRRAKESPKRLSMEAAQPNIKLKEDNPRCNVQAAL